MKIETRNEGPAIVVTPAGRLDGVGAPLLETELRDVAGRARGRTVLDCHGIDYIASAGLRALLIGAKACMQEGGELSVASLQPECRAVMEATGLLSVLNYHESVEAALAGATRVRLPEAGGSMEIAERQEGHTVVLSPAGGLDAGGASILLTRISAVIERGTMDLVLDCGGLTYVNSTGLRAVLIGAKACRQAGGTLAIAALSPQCRSVFEMSGFLSVIDYRETREAALDALARGG